MATLHLLCGKIAAGKSTLAAELSAPEGTVLIAEDAWIAALYGDAVQTPKDYMRCSGRLRTALAPHITGLLGNGLSVVLDFQANTVESRVWMRDLIETSGADHRLHVLTPPDDVLLARLKARNESGTHPFTVTEAQFHQVSKYFEPPQPDEGFTLVTYDA